MFSKSRFTAPGAGLLWAALLATCFSAATEVTKTSEPVTFETQYLKYVIAPDGTNLGFIDKRTGTDYCGAAPSSKFAVLTKQGTQYAGSIASRSRNRLELQFGNSGTTAVVGVKCKQDYVAFEVLKLTNSEGVSELSLLNLSLNLKGQPGEPFAACAVDLNLNTFNSNIPGFCNTLRVHCNAKDGLAAKVAVVACPGDRLRDLLKEVVRAHKELPQTKTGGPWALDGPINRGSYVMDLTFLIEKGSISESNVDGWAKLCNEIGVKQIDIICGPSLRHGDLEPNPSAYPNGYRGLKTVISKLHAAGIAAGLHTYSFYLAKDSKWVTPVPDPRLGKAKVFTLSQDLDSVGTTVGVDESTRDMSTVTGFGTPNSVTLQIDQELIDFSEVDKEPPYSFTRCTRGAHGTTASSHSKNAKVYQLKELFGLFSPDGDSTLFDEVAQQTARVYNDCGFDMIYLDAIDGAGALAGSHTPNYYQGKFVYEVCKHLKKSALMEMSSFDSHLWFARSRMGAWDVPWKSYKMFVNRHFLDNRAYDKSFLPTNIGWWAIWDWTPKEHLRVLPNDIEYFMCKALAADSSVSWTESFTPGTFGDSYNRQRLSALIKQYEGLRLSNYFSPATRERLAEINQDFTLEQPSPGQWQLRPVTYDKHEVAAVDGHSNIWTARNKYKQQPVKLRIEAKLSLARYDAPDGVVVEDFSQPSDYTARQASPSVSCSLESVSTPVKESASSACYSVKNDGAESANAWSVLTKSFKGPINFTERGFGVWIYGDGSGQVLNLMWKGPANLCYGIDEHYVDIDFTGWRYFEFVEPESDRVGTYHWPYHRATGAPYLEANTVTYDKIDSLTLGCTNIPSGKDTKCYLGPIKALNHVKTKLSNPSVSIGGAKISFPTQMESGCYLEFRSMADCKLYGPKGELLGDVKPQGEVPTLNAGENSVEFNCGIDGDVNARATVTLISEDETALGK